MPPQPPAFLLKLKPPRPFQREPDPTGRRSVSVSRRIEAPAREIFAVLANPRRHPEIDGSGTVVGIRPGGPTRLGPGVRFGADMRLFVPYRVVNTVVEFEEGRRIAWAHAGGQRWRYVLEPLDDGSTLVTETFDWSTAKIPLFVEQMGFPKRNVPAMDATLARLEQVVVGGRAGQEGSAAQG